MRRTGRTRLGKRVPGSMKGVRDKARFKERPRRSRAPYRKRRKDKSRCGSRPGGTRLPWPFSILRGRSYRLRSAGEGPPVVGDGSSFRRAVEKNRVLLTMLAVSVALHVLIFGAFWGMRLLGGAVSKPSLVSREFLIDLGPPLKPEPPSVRLPNLKPPSGPPSPTFDPPAGKPINILTTTAPGAMAGLPSGGADLKSRMPGLGGLGKSLGGGPSPHSFSLGGGRVRASAIIVLLDASGSMQEDRKFERAREKILQLTKQAGIRVVTEIAVPNCAFTEIAPLGADPQSPADAAYAMSAAMRRYPFADAIYFFSDFQDPVDPAVVDELRRIAMGSDPKVAVYLHTLEQRPDPALVALCKATGGQVLK